MTSRVIVVGAGLAGLTVADELGRRGFAVTMLEARDRVGGRCFTSDGIDHGAHWIHGTEGNPVTNLAHELRLATLFVGGDSSYSGGWDHLVLHGPGGRVLSPDEKLRSILTADEIRDDLDAERRRRLAAGEPDVSLHQVVEQAIAKRALSEIDRRSVEWHVTLSARDDCAADEPSLSFLWWDDGYEVYGYGDSVFTNGYGDAASGLAKDLDIRLEHPVRRIEYDNKRPVKVHTDKEVFEAEGVIVTAPLGVLKAGDLTFEPALPEAKLEAIKRLGMGALTKLVLRFKEPFWPRDQYVFGYLCQPVRGNPTMIVNLWKTHRQPVLVLLTGGSLGREIERWPENEMKEWGLRVLRDVFGDKVPKPVSVERTQWDVDPYSRGSYSYVAVGSTPADIETLAEPVAGRVFFAGEATHPRMSARPRRLSHRLRETDRISKL